jgi:hypothetical protein
MDAEKFSGAKNKNMQTLEDTEYNSTEQKEATY